MIIDMIRIYLIFLYSLHSPYNIHSLTISNNPLLRYIVFGKTNEENDGCMENVESIEISSIF